MTTSITPDYFFITALPTPTWGRVLRFCQNLSKDDEQLSKYHFDAQAGLVIDVKPSYTDYEGNGLLPSGTFFSERYHQHTFADVVDAVREGVLDHKALTYPELLSGQDTMIVFFWPDEEAVSRDGMKDDTFLSLADQLFEKLVKQSERLV